MDTATTEIYTLSLHDALPIYRQPVRDDRAAVRRGDQEAHRQHRPDRVPPPDRKSTRLNSSHSQISYAVFCLKKKRRLKLVVIDIQITLKQMISDFIGISVNRA